MTQPVMPAQSVTILDVYTEQIKMAEQLRNLNDKLPDHENRIRKLEAWRYGLPLANIIAIGALALSAYGWAHK